MQRLIIGLSDNRTSLFIFKIMTHIYLFLPALQFLEQLCLVSLEQVFGHHF